VDRVCPLLGLAGDRRSVVDGVDSAHRCHAESPPAVPTRQEQAQLCLTRSHPRCDRYLRFVAASDGGVPGRFPIGDGLVSTRMVLTATPAWRGIAGRARRAPRGPLVLGAGAALALGAGGLAVATGAVDLGLGDSVPSASASPTASPTPAVTATPRPTPSPTVEPTVSPTVAPTLAPTPTPAPTVPPPTTYVVQSGDTLAAIAQQFGTTVEALQAANGIEDPDQISVGQVLVIP